MIDAPTEFDGKYSADELYIVYQQQLAGFIFLIFQVPDFTNSTLGMNWYSPKRGCVPLITLKDHPLDNYYFNASDNVLIVGDPEDGTDTYEVCAGKECYFLTYLPQP